MLTPRFSISQDADFVYIQIMAPYIKVADAECHIHDDEFYFHSQPYYLRLHLPGKILDNEFSKSQYDVDTGKLTVSVAKETKGEVFEGLDMLTKLLTPKTVANANCEIEIVGNSINEQPDIVTNEVQDEEFDWFLEQKINETPWDLLINGPSYGFARRKSNVLNALMTDLQDLVDLKDPDNVPASQRSILREEQEREQFNCEHYLADLFEDEIIEDLILNGFPELTGTVGVESVFTEKEKEKLLQLPRREYVLDDPELKATYLGLVDLVFAYAYNFRFTRGEPNVESDWTICKLCATLSWLDSFENIQDLVVSCARRSLCFPLYRSWKLFHRVFSDVQTVFLVGKPQILKCLLGIQKILAESDTRYPLNDLYITDYCVWLQSADTKRIESVAKALSELKISKSDLGLKLDEMEADAAKLMNECVDEKCSDNDEKEEDIERLANALSNIVKVKDATVVDSDDENDTCEDDDDSKDDNGSDEDDDSEESSGSDSDDTDENDKCNRDDHESINDKV